MLWCVAHRNYASLVSHTFWLLIVNGFEHTACACLDKISLNQKVEFMGNNLLHLIWITFYFHLDKSLNMYHFYFRFIL